LKSIDQISTRDSMVFFSSQPSVRLTEHLCAASDEATERTVVSPHKTQKGLQANAWSPLPFPG